MHPTTFAMMHHGSVSGHSTVAAAAIVLGIVLFAIIFHWVWLKRPPWRAAPQTGDVERWREMLDARKGMNTQEPNYWGDMSEADDITRWKRIVDERFNKLERDQKKLDGGKRRWKGLAVGGAIFFAFAGATAVYRSAIPFGNASSWSSATGNDPSATAGVWFNANNHSFTHQGALDYQMDTVPYSVQAYGAVCNGTADDTTAFRNAFAAAPAGSWILLPETASGCVLTDTVTVTKNNTHVVGAGSGATLIVFNPASAKAAISFDNGFVPLDRLYGGSISGITFQAKSGNTQQKIAIDLVDTSGVSVSDIWVDPRSSAAPPWSGNNSIGIRLRGRELTNLSNIRSWADTPIEISVDPYISTPVNCDHTSMSGLYLLSTPGGGNSDLKIDDNIIVTNFNIYGDNAFVVDKYGIFWSDTASTTVSTNFSIENIRMEQAQDATGYGVYIDRTNAVLQNVNITNVMPATAQNGIHMNGVQDASIRSTVFGANTAVTLLDIGTVTDLWLDNNFVNSGAVVNLGTMKLVWAAPNRLLAQPMPSTAYYTDSSTYSSRGGLQLSTNEYMSNVTTFTNNSTANTNPLTFDTTNLFTSSNRLMSIKNQGTEKFFVDSGGSVVTTSGIVDTSGSTQLALGNSQASSVALGRAGASGVFVSAPTIAAAVAGTQTIGGGGSYFGVANVRHYAGAGSVPGTPAAGTGCATSSAPSVTGTDSSSTVNITCGATGATSATVLTMGFNTSWGASPRCFPSAANAATAAIPVAQQPFLSASSSTLTMTSNTTGLAAGTYSWYVKCEQ